jgi:hypothetical protein
MGILEDLKDKVLGTEEQNKAAEERMKKEDAKSPDTAQAKVNRMVETIKPTKEPVKKAMGGTIKSASSRADGIAIRGKTRA